MSLDKIILNLGILSSIPENGRIRRTASGISIEEDSSFQGLLRFYNQDSRAQGLDDIYEILTAAFERCDSIMQSVYLQDNTDNSIESQRQRNKNREDLQTLHAQLEGTIGGLENLRGTYIKDTKTNLALKLIGSKISKKIAQVGTFINNIK